MLTRPLFEVALLLSIASSAYAHPRKKYARVVNSTTIDNSTYDFIVAGGGTAGLTVADRLTEDPNTLVLVVEFGPFDQGEPTILVPGQYNPAPYFWPAIFSTPQTWLNNASFFVPMGSLVGGGSAVNAMIFHRGTSTDYNAWEALGNQGWGWSELLPYFKKSENFTRPDTSFARENNITWDEDARGFSGPVQISYAPYFFPGSKNFWTAALAAGIKERNPAIDSDLGLSALLRAIDSRTQTRSYSRITHYDRVISFRPNYHVLPEHAVGKVVFEQKRAVGIEYVSRATGEVKMARARKEVILAAGGVHSPQILQLSGIGPKAVLESLGINVVVDLPGVGQNFQDHLTLKVNYQFESNIEPNAGMLNTNQTYDAEQKALYESSHNGAYTLTRGTGNNIALLALQNATTRYQSIIDIAKSQDPASLLPPNSDPSVIRGYKKQREILFSNYGSVNSGVGSISWNTGSETAVYMIKPFSRGSITISSTDPLSNPLIDYRALSDPTDLEVLLALYHKNREIMAKPSMQVLGPTEISPAGNLTGDEQIKAALRATVNPSNAHQCCTLAMMDRELGGVVDQELRVFGVTGLSAVDISVWPIIIAAAPHASVYALAEKAADLIKERHGISP